MANMNIRTPRFFPDLISYHRARGYERGTVTATGGSGATATRDYKQAQRQNCSI